MSDIPNTPTPWYILEIPEHPDKYFIAAKPTPDHPYSGHTRNIDIAGDEDYPRKRADCELIVRAVNSHDAFVEALQKIKKECRYATHSSQVTVYKIAEAALKLAGK